MKKMISLRTLMAAIVIIGLGRAWNASAQVLIKDFIVGPNTYTNITLITSIRDTIAYMSQDGDLWKTDGTCDGTVLIKDFAPAGYPTKFTPVVWQVFFSATDATHGRELWATAGTEASTHLVKDIYPGTSNGNPDHFCAHHNLVYFAATNNKGEELWRSDGTDAGTTMVTDLRPGTTGSNPAHMTIFKDTLFFVATTSIGPALWKSDGTAAGTVLVKDFAASSTLGSGGGLQVVGNKLLLWVNDNVHGAELWVSDGSTAGTQMVKDINPGSSSGITNAAQFHPLGNIMYFRASDGIHGEELWRSDGTEAGTIMVKDIYPLTSGSYIDEIIHVNNIIYFDASGSGTGKELWRSDGTEAGTYMVLDIEPAPNSGSAPKLLTPMDNGFYFLATNAAYGYELWWSDGTSGNTVLVKDIWPGNKSSNPRQLARVKNEIVFTAETEVSGEELWSTGPTPSGPLVDAEINSVTNEKCSGDWTGAIDITVTGGDCPVVFQWVGGPFSNKYYTEDLTGLRAGVYNLTITDAKGSTKVLSVEITQPPSLTAQLTSQTPPDCLGNLGAITIAAQGGTPPYEYLWENGVVESTVTDIPFPGEYYTVSITDANGCVFDWGTFGTYAELPFKPYLEVTHPISCYNDLAYIFSPDGTKPVQAEGLLNILYHWEAGPGGEIVSDPDQLEIVVRGAANYYLTVTASTSGCLITDSITVSADFLPPLADAGPDIQLNCSMDEIVLMGSGSANDNIHDDLQVHWEAFDGGNLVGSPYELTPIINRPGTYVLTVQNTFNGCIATDTTVVTSQLVGPELSVEGSPTFCLQDSLELLAVFDQSIAVFQGWYTSGGLYSSNPTLVMAESEGWTYVVAKVSNAEGCVTEYRTELLRDGQLSFVSLSADSLRCGGVPIKAAYNYPNDDDLIWSWSGPNGFFHQGKEPIVFAPGWYYLTLAAGDCVISDAIQVVGERSINVGFTQITPPSCSGAPDGQIQLYDLTGAWTYHMVWSNGALGSWVGYLEPGHYWVGISGGADIDGSCYIRKDFDLPYPDTIQIELLAMPDSTGGNNGSISSTVTGAAPPFYYLWSNGASTASISGLAPGVYTLTVTYNLDYYCTATSTIEVPFVGCALEVAETMHQNNACDNDTSGQIQVSTLHGTPPFTFLWSNGANTPALTDLSNGVYVVTVTDHNDCTTTLETAIIADDTLPPVLQLTQLTRSLDTSGHLSLTAQDFNSGSYDNCVLSSFDASPLEFGCDDLGLRIIDITATDAAGNVTTGQTTLIVQDNVPPQLSCPENIVAGSCENTVAFSIPQVSDEICVAYDPSRLMQLEGLPSGAAFPQGMTTQMFQYTKLNGLSATCSFTVTIAPAPSSIEMKTTGAVCYGVCTGSASVLVTGGAPPFEYAWNTGQTDATLTEVCGGLYMVTIYDQYDCSWSDSAQVTETAPMQLALDYVVDDHNGMGIGSINIYFFGGLPPYQFAWYMDTLLVGSTPNLEGLYAGKYYCVMTDSVGCSITSDFIMVNNYVKTVEPTWAEGFLLAPNPASGEVQVILPANYTIVPRINVLDALGKPAYGVTIRQNNAGKIVLDVSNLVPGIYWVQLIVSDGRTSRKLVVVH